MARLRIEALLTLAALSLFAACTDPSGPSGNSSTMTEREAHPPQGQASTTAHVKGTASYRERIALPADAVFEATLEDASRADAQAAVLGRARTAPAGHPPYNFDIAYDPAQLQAGHNYAIRARITQGGQLLFTTDRHYALPSSGEPVELLLVRAGAQQTPAQSTAALENTYWKLTRLGDEVVTLSNAEREPYLVLHSEEQRVGGFGGCNRLTGSYSLSGETLTFSQMAATMMACDDGMEQERAFSKTLEKVARWRIEGETLELFDAAGVSLAQFESRYLR